MMELDTSTFPILRTERLNLRQMSEDDADNLYHMYADGQVARYLDWNGPASTEEAGELIADWNLYYDNKALLPWGIAKQSDNELIGTIMLMPLRGTFDAEPLYPVTIGFELAQPYWNRGLMSEALRAVTDYGLRVVGAHRLQAEVAPANEASVHLLRKAGFEQEGLLRQYLKHEVTGQFLDVAVMALVPG